MAIAAPPKIAATMSRSRRIPKSRKWESRGNMSGFVLPEQRDLRDARSSRQRATLPSGPAVHLRPPPADADKQKPPVVKEFRWLTLKGMADELEQPPQYEQPEGQPP